MAKITKQKFKDALVGSYGIQSVIAQKMQVTRGAVTQFIDKYPEFRQLCEQERDKIIDVSENRLFKAANDGEKWAVDKILKTIGRNRGYVEKSEVEYSGELSSNITIQTIIPKEVRELLNDDVATASSNLD